MNQIAGGARELAWGLERGGRVIIIAHASLGAFTQQLRADLIFQIQRLLLLALRLGCTT